MGTQRPVKFDSGVTEDLGSPIAEHHGKIKEKTKGKKEKVEDKIKESKFKKEKIGIEQPEKEKKEEKIEEKPEEKKSPKKEKAGKAKVRSKKYKNILSSIDRNKKYDINSGIDLAKKTTLTKFDGNIEVHVRILNKNGKPESIRGILEYPHSTGKKLKIIILDEKKIEEIEKTKKTDFDIAIANPKLMPKVAKLAKILGPKGKMPNPKSGTVSNEPEKTKKELEEGKVEYKTDGGGNIHQVIGKISADNKILLENFNTLISVLPKDKITSITICATMGPGIKILI